MKIVLFSLLCLILIGMTSYSYAFWINPPYENPELIPKVMMQLELRDSNGNLQVYLEADQIIGVDLQKLNRFLDNLNQTSKEFLVIDDKKYESQQWKIASVQITEKHAYSGTRIVDVYQNEFITILIIRHDSYQTQPGDMLTIFWTVIRPAS